MCHIIKSPLFPSINLQKLERVMAGRAKLPNTTSSTDNAEPQKEKSIRIHGQPKNCISAPAKILFWWVSLPAMIILNQHWFGHWSKIKFPKKDFFTRTYWSSNRSNTGKINHQSDGLSLAVWKLKKISILFRSWKNCVRHGSLIEAFPRQSQGSRAYYVKLFGSVNLNASNA